MVIVIPAELECLYNNALEPLVMLFNIHCNPYTNNDNDHNKKIIHNFFVNK